MCPPSAAGNPAARHRNRQYRQLRSRVGLQRYSEAEITAKLAISGFSASRAHVNIGHNPWRMTFVARHALMGGAEQKD